MYLIQIKDNVNQMDKMTDAQKAAYLEAHAVMQQQMAHAATLQQQQQQQQQQSQPPQQQQHMQQVNQPSPQQVNPNNYMQQQWSWCYRSPPAAGVSQ